MRAPSTTPCTGRAQLAGTERRRASRDPAPCEVDRDCRSFGQPARASYFVGTYLLSSSPYDVYFVNPRADEILGRKAYASLADLPVVPDIVDVFRRDEDLPGVAREAVEIGAQALWLQLGSWNEEAAGIAEAAGLGSGRWTPREDRACPFPRRRLHLAGFDTGVISSKRQVVAR